MGGDVLRQERQFAVNWIIKDRDSPMSDLEFSSRFPDLKPSGISTSDKTSQNENHRPENGIILFIFFVLPENKRDLVPRAKRYHVKGPYTRFDPFLGRMVKKERKRKSGSKSRANRSAR